MNSIAKVCTGPRSAASHKDTAGSDSISRPPPATPSVTQPMSGTGPISSVTAATTAEAEPKKCAEANSTASEGDAPPSAALACTAACCAAARGSAARTSASPAFTSSGYPPDDPAFAGTRSG